MPFCTTQGSQKLREDAHNWMIREFLLSYSSGVPKLLLPSQLLLIHLPRCMLVVRAHFG